MRKVYLVIGAHPGSDYYTWVSGVYASRKKALEECKRLKETRPMNEYNIQTEVLL